ncbi:MAG TPA: GNAT family N-acetyltransferase [Clostridia bacterium]|nr:GNAT family N-acetyltransferase [Clostridia bacterium]
MDIGEYIKKKLLEKGASIVGFADMSGISEQARKGLPYGIIIGIALDPAIVSGITNGPTMEYYEEYCRINTRLNELDKYAERLLKNNGYEALAKTSETVAVDESNWRTELPHKTVATRAGLGWIGKCALLVTEEFGSAIRISSVLTNAELKAGTPVNLPKCGNCSICKDVCPAGAVSGELWEAARNRDEFYNAFKCRSTAIERSSKIGIDESLCGLCIVKCPWTRRYIAKSIRYTAGGLELLPQVGPLWYGLREHHSVISDYFSKSIKARSFEDRAEDFTKNADRTAYMIELAKTGGADRAVGYCISSVGSDLTGEVESLFVDGAYRGLGIGEQLMKSSLAWMDEKGAKRKRVNMMAGNNVLEFYERFGFKVRSMILEQVENR